jgi:hypothetical protein
LSRLLQIYFGKIPFYYIVFFITILFFGGRDISATLANCPLLPSGRDSIFQVNTLLLYSVFYYYPFSSGCNTLVAPASCPFLLSGHNFIFRADTLLLYSTLYYYYFFQAVILQQLLLAVPFLGQLVFFCF